MTIHHSEQVYFLSVMSGDSDEKARERSGLSIYDVSRLFMRIQESLHGDDEREKKRIEKEDEYHRKGIELKADIEASVKAARMESAKKHRKITEEQA